MKERYKVLVVNRGVVYDGRSLKRADDVFNGYVAQSLICGSHAGRTTLFRIAEEIRDYPPKNLPV